MVLESKAMGFQLEPERSISSHEVFYKDNIEEGSTTEQDIFVKKDCNASV